jgi:hypothetical protein
MNNHENYALNIIENYTTAKSERRAWESLWQECYDVAFPQRGDFSGAISYGKRRGENLFDGTALDGVDQLAASLMGHLVPPFAMWFGLRAGSDVSVEESRALSGVLEKAARTLQTHFDQSNFAVEIHQCFLDLVVAGTASLVFEETAMGEPSAFRFSALPLRDVVMMEGYNGGLDHTYRSLTLNLKQLKARYQLNTLDDIPFLDKKTDNFQVIESVVPSDQGFIFTAALYNTQKNASLVLIQKNIKSSPFLNFRWMKSPGEVYGRSPIMKALPDIRTANKVVELILKNASIAVTGIWQAEDDGVLNPANIELVPGAIIPKALGSKGLTPLEMPGRFDVSQLILSDLRARIRHALLVDRLSQIDGPRMTATEILERSSEMALLLGATYGRLQVELLTPLLTRAYNILRMRGEIPDLPLDGRIVCLDFRSPLARVQSQKQAQNILSFLQNIQSLGAEAAARVDFDAVTAHLAETLGIPSDFLQKPQPPQTQGDVA